MNDNWVVHPSVENHKPDLEVFNNWNDLSAKEKLDFKIKSMNERVGDLNLTDQVNCDTCKNKGIIYYALDDYEMSKDCKCQTQRKIVYQLRKSGLLHEFKTRTFANFKTTENYQKVLKDAALDFLEKGKGNWFVALGQSGAGKTHICTAISEELIQRGYTFEYFPYARYINELTNGLRSFDQATKEDALYLLNRYKRAQVLYIDDLLKFDVRVDVIFDLIDYRYSNDLTTIISSERSMNELLGFDVAVAGRIKEKTGKNGKYLISIKNDPNRNYRMKEEQS